MSVSKLVRGRNEGRSSRRRRIEYLIAFIGVAVLAGALMMPGASAAPTMLAAGSGCGKAPALTSGTRSIFVGGQNRTYVLSIPDNYDSNHPYRLIFGQHWLNGTATDVATGGSDGAVWAYYGQQQLSNNSTIFVAPQGIDNGWANTSGRDLALIDSLTDLVQNSLCVDPSLIFAMGWSYGGAMSYALACARPAVFRAVVVYSGANLSGCSGGTQPVAYFGIHGTHDSVLNISNGRSLRDTFVRNNRCTPQTPAEPLQGSLTHITTAYSGCRPGYPVQWAAFDGDHIPSPVDGSTAMSGARTWTSAQVWRFITQFASTTPSTPPTTTVPPTPGNCAVSATVNAWNSGLVEEITITNRGTTAIGGWKLAFTLPAGQVVTGGWSATYAPSSGTVEATNVSYNGSLAPGASTSIGFQATHTGNSAAASSFTLNGATCD